MLSATDSIEAMRHHAVNLLGRSGHAFIESLGTTTLGFFAQPLVSLLIVVITLGIIFGRRGGIVGVKTHVRESITTTLVVGVTALLLVYGAIFGWSVIKTIYIDHMSLVAATASRRVTSVLSPDDARLAIVNIGPIIRANRQPPAILRVSYANQGRSVSVGFAHDDIATGSTRVLTNEEVEEIMSIPRATQDTIAKFERDSRENYPVIGPVNPLSPGTQVFDIPLPQKSTASMLAGSVYLYVFTSLFYRDRLMLPGVYGVTKSYSYYFGGFDLAHNCFSRSRLERKENIMSTMTEQDTLNYLVAHYPVLGH